jgi:hypothetical protein
VLAGLDALAPQPADFLAHIRRIFRLADVDELKLVLFQLVLFYAAGRPPTFMSFK